MNPFENQEIAALQARVQALELMLQHLVTVLDAKAFGFNAQQLDDWLCIARDRMAATGSVSPETQAALAALQRQVM